MCGAEVREAGQARRGSRGAVSVALHAGVYFGTCSGKVFASIDEGESSLADGLPPVVAVKTAAVS